MINGKNQYDARNIKEFNKQINCFVDELLLKIGAPKSKSVHIKGYSCLYEIMKNSAIRGDIESCHSLVNKLKAGNFTIEQKTIAADRLKGKIKALADQASLCVKRERRLCSNNFAKMIKAIVIDRDIFNRYIECSDLSIKYYYEAQRSAIAENGKHSITYETLSRPEKTNTIF